MFLFGGVDGNSLVIPIDAAGYAQYSAVRTASSGVNLTQAQLLPIQPAGTGAYGLNPNLSAIHPLFELKKLAILANVGTLNQPTTKSNYLAVRPENLFSHSDQQTQWQSSVSSGISRTGWGAAGRPACIRQRGFRLSRHHVDRRDEPLHHRRFRFTPRAAHDGRPVAAGLQQHGRVQRPPRGNAGAAGGRRRQHLREEQRARSRREPSRFRAPSIPSSPARDPRCRCSSRGRTRRSPSSCCRWRS
ncbi:MAG: hypothetical protein MZW92_36090 [Comamonadaceae bacterium]|nr:hypothetical protein [Comamonadaceae bacterium]